MRGRGRIDRNRRRRIMRRRWREFGMYLKGEFGKIPGWTGLVIINCLIVFGIFALVLVHQVKSFTDDEQYLGTTIEPPRVVETSRPVETPKVWSEPENPGREVLVIEDVLEEEEEPEPEPEQVKIWCKDWDAQDTYYLAKIAQCEAGNQDIEVMEMVIKAVLNRVWSKQFPNTIEEVLFQHRNGVWQFSPLAPGGSWYKLEPSEKAYQAVDNVMAAVEDDSGGCMYFESFYSDEDMYNSWHYRNLEFLFKMGDMRFYK